MFLKRFHSFLPFILLSVIVLYFLKDLFFPYPQFISNADFGQSDIWMLNIPFKYLMWHALSNNSIPLWTSLIGNGFPIAAESQIGLFNPINIILLKFLPFAYAFNSLYFVAFITTSFGTYLFAKKIGLSSVSSFYSSILFSFSGFFVTHLTHTNIIQTAAYLPWFFLSILYLTECPSLKRLVFSSSVIGLSFLSGHFQTTFIMMLGGVLFFIYLCLHTIFSRRKNAPKNIKKYLLYFALSIALGIGIASIQILPSLEFKQQSQRNSGFSLEDANYFSFPPEHLLGFLDPFVFGNPSKGTYPHYLNFNSSIFWENSGYIGITPLIFIFLSLFIARKRPIIVFFIILALISLLLMFGKYTIFKYVNTLPVFSFFRVPSRNMLLLIWSGSMLAGISFDYFKDYFKKYIPNYILWVSLIMVISISVIDIFGKWKGYTAFISPQKLFEKPILAKSINSGAKVLSIDSGDQWDHITGAYGWQKMDKLLFHNNSLRQNITILYNIKNVSVSAGSTLKNSDVLNSEILDGIKAQGNTLSITNQSLKLLDMQNVSYIVSRYPIQNPSVKEVKKVSQSNIVFYLYKLPASQNVFVIYNAIYNNSSAIEDLFKNDFNTKSYAFINKNISLKSGTENKYVATVKEYNEGRVLIEVKNNSSPGLLVLSDSYYPGWNAYVNGKKSEVLRTNFIQKGVIVPKGNSKVLFEYQPLSFFQGFSITALSVILTLLFIFIPQNVLLRNFKILLNKRT